jgi:hypothetical protein
VGKSAMAREVAAKVADALIVGMDGARTVGELHARLPVRPEVVLVVLDNLETLDAEALAHLESWMATGATRWLCTTRRQLELSVPHQEHHLQPLPHAACLVELARDIEADGVVLDRIARATHGLPLLMRLAVVRSRVLGADALAVHLEEHGAHHLGTPGAGREQSAADSVRWSIDHLPAEARDALVRLSVLPAAWAPEDGISWLGARGTRALDALHAWHLLAKDGGRLRVLPVVRSWVRENLAADEALRRDHLRWAASVAREVTTALGSADAVEAVVRAKRVWDIWLDALAESTLDVDASSAIVDVVGRVEGFASFGGPPSSVWSWLDGTPVASWPEAWRLGGARLAMARADLDTVDDLLAVPMTDREHEFQRLVLLARLERYRGRREPLVAHVAALTAIAETTGSIAHMAWVHLNESPIEEPVRSRILLRRACRQFEAADMPLEQATALVTLSVSSIIHHLDWEAASRHAQEGLALLQGLPVNRLTARLHLVLGMALADSPRPQDGRSPYLAAREAFVELGLTALADRCSAALAGIALAERDLPLARHLLYAETPGARHAERRLWWHRTALALLEEAHAEAVEVLGDLVAHSLGLTAFNRVLTNVLLEVFLIGAGLQDRIPTLREAYPIDDTNTVWQRELTVLERLRHGEIDAGQSGLFATILRHLGALVVDGTPLRPWQDEVLVFLREVLAQRG